MTAISLGYSIAKETETAAHLFRLVAPPVETLGTCKTVLHERLQTLSLVPRSADKGGGTQEQNNMNETYKEEEVANIGEDSVVKCSRCGRLQGQIATYGHCTGPCVFVRYITKYVANGPDDIDPEEISESVPVEEIDNEIPY